MTKLGHLSSSRIRKFTVCTSSFSKGTVLSASLVLLCSTYDPLLARADVTLVTSDAPRSAWIVRRADARGQERVFEVAPRTERTTATPAASTPAVRTQFAIPSRTRSSVESSSFAENTAAETVDEYSRSIPLYREPSILPLGQVVRADGEVLAPSPDALGPRVDLVMPTAEEGPSDEAEVIATEVPETIPALASSMEIEDPETLQTDAARTASAMEQVIETASQSTTTVLPAAPRPTAPRTNPVATSPVATNPAAPNPVATGAGSPGMTLFRRGNETVALPLILADGTADPQSLTHLALLARPRERTELPSLEERLQYESNADFLARDVHRLDPLLLNELSRLSERFPGHVIEVVSGYRLDATEGSRHRHGRALDIRIEGVPTLELFRAAIEKLQSGVGYYPNSDFVHIDVRDRTTRWIDESNPNESSRVRLIAEDQAMVEAETAWQRTQERLNGTAGTQTVSP